MLILKIIINKNLFFFFIYFQSYPYLILHSYNSFTTWAGGGAPLPLASAPPATHKRLEEGGARVEPEPENEKKVKYFGFYLIVFYFSFSR
jgi:hypothetical protein